jgi:hypothetical protein
MLRCQHEIAGGELPHSPNNRAVFTVLGAVIIGTAMSGHCGGEIQPVRFGPILGGRAIKAARRFDFFS